MTATRFDGTTLPPGWTAIEPAGGHVTVGGGYVALRADAGVVFDGLSSGTTTPEGPRISRPVAGSFDVAVGLASAVNSAEFLGLDLLAWDAVAGQGIRFAQYVSEVSGRGTNFFGRRQTPTATNNITLTDPPNEVWGPRSWMRLSWDQPTGTWTFLSSHTGRPGSWHMHVTFTNPYVPATVEVHMTQAIADAYAREMRVALVVDMGGRGDDATTPPGEVTTTPVLDVDLTGTTLPPSLAAHAAAGGSVVVADGYARLGTDTTVLGSYAWLEGPADLPPGHGMHMRYRFPQPSVQNSFAAPILRASTTTDLPASSVVQTDKFRPGVGLLAEINGGGSFGDIIRLLTAQPVAVDEPYNSSSMEFYGFAMMVENLTGPVDGSTGEWINLRMEALDGGYWRARFWYDVDPEPTAWQYEGEDHTQRGRGWWLAWAHNDSTSGAGGGVALMDVAELELYGIEQGTALVFDSFDRADAAVLGNADTGQPWTASNWGISGNTARKGGGGSLNVTVPAGIAGDHETEVTAILSAYAGGNQLFGPVTRYRDEDNFVLWERVLVPGAEDAVKLYVRTGATWNERAIYGGGPGATGLDPNAPLVLAVRQVGADLSCYVNGAVVASYTLTPGEEAALGTAAGIRNEGSLEAWFDDFSVVAVDEPTPVPEIAGALAVVVDLAGVLDSPAIPVPDIAGALAVVVELGGVLVDPDAVPVPGRLTLSIVPDPLTLTIVEGDMAMSTTVKRGDGKLLRLDLGRDLSAVTSARVLVSRVPGEPPIVDRPAGLAERAQRIVTLQLEEGDYGPGKLEPGGAYKLEVECQPGPLTHPDSGQPYAQLRVLADLG